MVTPPPFGLPRVFVACVLLLVALFAVFAIWLASAGRAFAHDPYSRWRDKRGFQCCDGRDCAPVRADLTPTGWQVWMEGRWVPVPWDAVLEGVPSPDGRSHACMSPGAVFVRCFVPADPRS